MRSDFYYRSCGAGMIHGCRWTPEGEVKAILQIVHGISERIERYDDFAGYLNGLGILVVGEDHMGHGKSVSKESPRGYFTGGWFKAVQDTYQLMKDTMNEYPDVPYVLFGHSMGSFMARTLLCEYPDSGIAAAIICGTGWQPGAVLTAGKALSKLMCKTGDETQPNNTLQGIVFGGYNKRVEHPRTEKDWLSRDAAVVDAYIADPLCGYVASVGLLRDMLDGIDYIQKPKNLAKMNKQLPVFFIAGGDDPVGAYGKGVQQAADAFQKAGMAYVTTRIYPLCRHEIHNEINKDEVYEDVAQWLKKVLD